MQEPSFFKADFFFAAGIMLGIFFSRQRELFQGFWDEIHRAGHVGGLTDLGRILYESGKKKVAPRWRHVGANQMLLHAKCF